MTAEKCQRYLIDVKRMYFFIVLLISLEKLPSTCKGEEYETVGRKVINEYRPIASQVSTSTMKTESDISSENHQAEIISEALSQNNVTASTLTEDTQKSEHSSINSIIQRLNVTTTKPEAITTTFVTTTVTEQDEVTTKQAEIIDYNDKNLCGVRPMVKSGRIVGGKDAKFGEWPWHVLVRESSLMGFFNRDKCGGVLITNKCVASAAYCQPSFLTTLKVVFGENDLSKDSEPRIPIDFIVGNTYIHEGYDATTFENNLAVLELTIAVQFNAYIVPICLPLEEKDYTGRVATVTGWGRLAYGGSKSSILQEVQVPVIDNKVCQEMYHRAGHAKEILNSFICAGYANGVKDSCEGDSGGPLVVQRDDGKWELVGTVSHGIKCAAPYLPGLYMRTSYYMPWLAKLLTALHGFS